MSRLYREDLITIRTPTTIFKWLDYCFLVPPSRALKAGILQCEGKGIETCKKRHRLGFRGLGLRELGPNKI